MRTIFLVILAFFLITDLQAQSKKKAQPSAKPEVVSIEVKSVEESSAVFTYLLSSKNYILFVSTIENPPRQASVKDKPSQVSDTLLYPKLKQVGTIGKLAFFGFSKVKGTLYLLDLPHKTDFFLHIYKPSKDSIVWVTTKSFNTLAPKPTRQSSQLAFEGITDTSFVVKWLNGNGEGRILVVSQSGKAPQPENGKQYNVSPDFGNLAAKLKNGYVVYDGKDLRPRVEVNKLKPATKYSVAVYEYNGEGKYRNYNTSSATNNPRDRATLLPAPRIISVEKVTDDEYILKWEKVPGASTYILDIAADEEFKNKVEPFIDLDIGDAGEFGISDLKQGNKYYIRLKAKSQFSESKYSYFEFITK